MASAIDPGVISAGQVSKAGVALQLQRARDEITALQARPTLPVGAVSPFAGATLPAGFLWCNGAAVSRSTYSALFTALGTLYGAGDGTTTFNLPDLRNRAPFGCDGMGGASQTDRITTAGSGVDGNTVGATGGSQFMQGHEHQVAYSAGAPGNTEGLVLAAVLGVTNDGHPRVINAGAGNSQNMPPAIILNYIICAGV